MKKKKIISHLYSLKIKYIFVLFLMNELLLDEDNMNRTTSAHSVLY